MDWSIGARIAIPVLQRLPWKKIWELVSFPRAKYQRRLQEKLAEMPFLFGDMQLSARDDYVELDVLTLSGGEYRRQESVARTYSHHGALSKFEAYRKAFLFADGGYGKTTLFRNLALEAIKSGPWKRFLGVRGILPIYVPLKVVQTANDFAIVAAIQASDPYFLGSRGLRRLKKIGGKGKILLLLDGYDEMPYTGGFEHVKRELEVLFEDSFRVSSAGLSWHSPFERSEYWPVYQAIRSSRIYLSSRREFFDYNQIKSSTDTQKWVVWGLEDRRISLVEKIFSRYRGRTENSSGRDLNAELFLQTLMRSDPSIVDLSKSPLFLTVMCYVYVTQGGEGGRSVFSMGAGDLVRTCVKLLLEDLDKYKSKGFDPATSRAMANRRSAYPEEKLEFLRYFSRRLYEEDLGYFGEAYVSDLARDYFRSTARNLNAQEILRGLESQDLAINIVRQIIMSGLFVLVEKRSESRLFDFPHRKFREVLAVDYFLSQPLTDDVIDALVSKKYSELALLFVDQSNHAFRIVGKLIDLIVGRTGSGHEQGLLVDVLKRMPRHDAEAAVLQLLRRINNSNQVSLVSGIWEFFPKTAENCAYLVARMGEAMALKTDFMLKEWAVASVKVGCEDCEALVLSASWDIDSLPCMRVLVESGLIKLAAGKDFLSRYIELAVRDTKTELEAGRLFVSNFYAGRSESERSDFFSWMESLTSFIDSSKEYRVGVRIKKLVAPED